MQPEDPDGDAVVIAQSDSPGEGGENNRFTLAEDASLKYPILLISAVVVDGSNVVSQSAVVGDRVVVAVLDTGVDYTHPDLAANMWSNVNGHHGYDFYNNDNDPFDDNGHGTHCAGIIAASGNNGIGVVGVAWQSKIMAVKCMGAAGVGYTSDRVQGVAYIRSMVETGTNVRVVSVSLGSVNSDSSELDDIQFLGSTGIVVVAAAGNDYKNFDDTGYAFDRLYPAAYAADNVISVAAMDRYGNMPLYSNRGSVDVDLSAPGDDILSTIPGGNYGTKSGTSMATPHVAGVAALLFSHDPTLSITRAPRLLLDGASPLAAPSDGWTVTDGCVNAARSLELLDAVAAPTFDPAPGFFDTNAVQVAMVSETPGAAIYFTTNGIDPDTTSSLYTGTVAVTMGTTLKARAYAAGITNSPVESGSYSWTRCRVMRWGLSLNPGWTTGCGHTECRRGLAAIPPRGSQVPMFMVTILQGNTSRASHRP